MLTLIRQAFTRQPFEFIEGEDLSEAEVITARRTLKMHRRRVSVFFRNAQILLAIAVGLKAGMYAVFVQQTFGVQAAAQLQAVYLGTYFCLNIIMGVLADGAFGRRKVYMLGVILFTGSYALYGIGTWTSCIIAEICFGSASAAVAGVLSVWMRNIIENTYYLRSVVSREEVDEALIATEANDYCRKSNKQVFGFRSIFMLATGTTGGFLATSWDPMGVWFIATTVCLSLVGYVWWHMFYNIIPVRMHTKRGSLETIRGAWNALRKNPLITSFVIIGLSFSAIVQVVKIAWVPIIEPVMQTHDIALWIATALTLLSSVSGGVIVILFEKTKRYKRKEEDEQTRFDFSLLRLTLVTVGVLMIGVRLSADMMTVGIVLGMFVLSGMFARIHAGSITSNTPAKSRRRFGTTMLSIYETGIAFVGLLSSLTVATLLKRFHWEVFDIVGLMGCVSVVCGFVIRMKFSN